MDEIVAEAFNPVTTVYDEAAHGVFSKFAPKEVAAAMFKFDANIRDNEWMEFQGSTGRDGKPMTLDSHRRERLLNSCRREKPRARKFEGIGTLTGIDVTRNSIQVQTEEHGDIRLPLDISMPVSRFNENLLAPVKISISGSIAANGKFKGVDEVHSVDLVEAHNEFVLECLEQLRKLSTIEKGWLGNGYGEEIASLATLRATHLVFGRPNFANLFRIYPTEHGGISVEFDKENWSLTILIMPDGPIEIDRCSPDGEKFQSESFVDLSKDFFEKFDEMTSVL